MKKLNLILIMVGLFILSSISVIGACPTLTGVTNITITEDCTLPTGTYYLNDTGSGAIRITGENVTLNCNSSTIIGNWSGNGIKNDYKNFTLTGCNIFNYNTCVYINGVNTTIDGNYLENCSNQAGTAGTGITSFAHQPTIKNNRLYQKAGRTTSNPKGINIYKNNNVLIDNNTVDGFAYNIRIFGNNSKNVLISNNNLTNDGQYCIQTTGEDGIGTTPNNVTISNTYCYNSTHNNYDLQGTNITLTGSYGFGWGHHSVDCYESNKKWGSNLVIKDSYFEGSLLYDDITSKVGVYSGACDNIYIYNITVKNLLSSTQSNYGILSDGNSSFVNNITVENSTLININGSIYSFGINLQSPLSTIKGNRFINISKSINGSDIRISTDTTNFPDVNSNLTILNNTYDDGVLDILFWRNSSSLATIYESSNIYLTNYYNTFNYAYFNWSYDASKNITMAKVINSDLSSVTTYNSTGYGVEYNLSSGENWKVENDVYSGNYKLPQYSPITNNITYSKGTFYLGGKTTGVLNITSANIIVNCNNLNLIGDFNAYAIYVNNHNITVKNCNLYNYSQTIRIRGKNNTITDVRLINSNKTGILIDSTTGLHTIKNVVMTFKNYSALYSANEGNSGIYGQADSYNVTITNVTISGHRIGINLWNNFNYLVEDSYIFNTSDNCIRDRGTNLSYHIFNRFIVEECGHNGLDLNCRYDTVSNGTCKNPNHHCVDTFNQASSENASFAIIDSNTFIINKNIGENNNIIYNWNSTNITITNNKFVNCTNGNVCFPIYSEGNSLTSTGFLISGNEFNDSESACIAGIFDNSIITKNKFRNCAKLEGSYELKLPYSVGNFRTNINIYNNTYFDGSMNIYSQYATPSVLAQYSIYENTGTLYWNLSVSELYLLYSGLKNLSITNNTITASNLPAYNSYCNSTGCYQDYNNFTTVVGSGQNVHVIEVPTSTSPRIYSKDSGIIFKSYSYTTNTVLAINSTGSGTYAVSNMNDISTTYYLNLNGVNQLYSGNAIYTFPNSGYWLASRTEIDDAVCVNTITDFAQDFGEISTLLSLIVIFLVYGSFKFYGKEFNIDSEFLTNNMGKIAFGIVIYVLVLVIITLMSQTTC